MTRFGMLLLTVVVLLLTACGTDESGSGGDGGAAVDQDEECLVVEDTVEGDGKEATPGSLVTVHYTGRLENGTEFDSSLGGEPFTFQLGGGQVIQGWDEGIVGMKVGGQRTLTICSDMAYGEEDHPSGTIPGGSTLIFDVELLKVRSPA